MASLAEMFIGDIQKQNEERAPAWDAAGDIAKFAALKQQRESQMAQLQQKQEELQQAKWEKVSNLYTLYDKLPDGPAKKTFGTKVIPANLNSLGLSQELNPAVAEMLNSDPQLGVFLASKARQGLTSNADISQAVKDPEKFTQLVTKLGISTWADEKLLSGTQDRYSKDIAAGEKDFQGAEAQKARAQSYATQADTRKDEQAANAVNRINTDKPTLAMQDLIKSSGNDLMLLKDQKHPPNIITIKEIAANAAKLISQSPVSSDFKIKEISPDTLQGELSKISQFLTSNPENAPAPPGMVQFWTHTLERLQDAGQRNIAARAKQLKREAKTVYSKNPNAVAAVESTANAIATGEAMGRPKQVIINGKAYDVEKAKQFLKDHPKDSMVPVIQKELKDLGEL